MDWGIKPCSSMWAILTILFLCALTAVCYFAQVHNYVLQNAACLQPYRIQYSRIKEKRSQLQLQFRRENGAHVAVPKELLVPSFKDWIIHMVLDNEILDVPLEVQEYIRGPSQRASFYTSWRYRGSHYRVQNIAIKRQVTCDSGVKGIYEGVNGKQVNFYGHIMEIIVVDFGAHTKNIPLLKVEFYNTTVDVILKDNDSGFIKLQTVKKFSTKNDSDEPIVGLDNVEQVFYVSGPTNSDWLVVIEVQARSKRVYVSESVTRSINTTEGTATEEDEEEEEADIEECEDDLKAAEFSYAPGRRRLRIQFDDSGEDEREAAHTTSAPRRSTRLYLRRQDEEDEDKEIMEEEEDIGHLTNYGQKPYF
jgi:hypothetical protein